MIQKPFDQIEKADLDALVADSVAEGRTLDYKQALSGNSDGEKKELLADVSSFANASGGDLIFGMTETGGTATGAPGLAGINADSEILRLDACFRNGIEPRIPEVQIRVIEGFAKGPVLLIRIPRSWASPHMVTFKGTSRFFTRNNAGKHPMDMGEIRAAFALSESVPERIRNFRIERIGKVVADDTPVQLSDNPKIVLHLVPLSAFAVGTQLEVKAIYERRGSFHPISSGSDIIRYNVDGVISICSSDRDGKGPSGYCQVFRTGIVESVDARLIRAGREERWIPSLTFERELLRSTRMHIEALSEVGVVPPIVVTVSLVGVRGYEMAKPRGWDKWEATPIDRDELILPEILIEDFGDDIASAFRPIFDAAWNASGWQGSPYFNENGDWSP
ncbi:MAG: ATP-binding protein [Planctomycetes bacterium]|nr:ATP-binding protein [Planctomycetota bacterium]